MQSCSICRSALAPTVDGLLRAGKPASVVARQTGLSDQAVRRHRRAGHHELPGARLPSPPQPPRDDEDTASMMRTLVASLRSVDTSQLSTTGQVAHFDATRRAIDALARIAPARASTVTLDEVEGLQDLVTAWYDALEPWPDARRAMVGVLEERGMVPEPLPPDHEEPLG